MKQWKRTEQVISHTVRYSSLTFLSSLFQINACPVQEVFKVQSLDKPRLCEASAASKLGMNSEATSRNHDSLSSVDRAEVAQSTWQPPNKMCSTMLEERYNLSIFFYLKFLSFVCMRNLATFRHCPGKQVAATLTQGVFHKVAKAAFPPVTTLSFLLLPS